MLLFFCSLQKTLKFPTSFSLYDCFIQWIHVNIYHFVLMIVVIIVVVVVPAVDAGAAGTTVIVNVIFAFKLFFPFFDLMFTTEIK